jgi:hypothetical protein
MGRPASSQRGQLSGATMLCHEHHATWWQGQQESSRVNELIYFQNAVVCDQMSNLVLVGSGRVHDQTAFVLACENDASSRWKEYFADGAGKCRRVWDLRRSLQKQMPF